MCVSSHRHTPDSGVVFFLNKNNFSHKRKTTHPHDDAHALAFVGKGEELQDGEVQDLVARGPQLHGRLVAAHQRQAHALGPLHQGHLNEARARGQTHRRASRHAGQANEQEGGCGWGRRQVSLSRACIPWGGHAGRLASTLPRPGGPGSRLPPLP